MTDEQFQQFILAIKRGSMPLLDGVLPIEGMATRQLNTLYREIGKDYARHAVQNAIGLDLTIADMMERYG